MGPLGLGNRNLLKLFTEVLLVSVCFSDTDPHCQRHLLCAAAGNDVDPPQRRISGRGHSQQSLLVASAQVVPH